MIVRYQNLVFNSWGWNGQSSAETIKRGGLYKVSSIESQIKIKMAFVYKIILLFTKVSF
jgi:hypothetical protein